ncbi:hypothetical protein V1264_022076 [Littorina saxatilis]|uniref:C2H2-type domain-containing protein n=1 Tax=Littorina saxatilis TaxID=31220 RepID=A0AAN9AJR5_9CAEN
MEEGDTALLSDVKIEIDVAEEMPQYWHGTEQHPHVPVRKVAATENTATVHGVQTLEGQDSLSTHSDTWLKKEKKTPESQTAVETHSDIWLKQSVAVNAHVPVREVVVTEYIATKHAVQTLDGQAAIIIHSDTWLKQEIETPETQTAVNTDSDMWQEQDAGTPKTQSAVNTHCGIWLKEYIETPETQTTVTADGNKGEKKHACRECSARFTRSGDLKKHIQVKSHMHVQSVVLGSQSQAI